MPRFQRDEALERIRRFASDPYEDANPDAICPECDHWKDMHGSEGCSACDCGETWEDWPPSRQGAE